MGPNVPIASNYETLIMKRSISCFWRWIVQAAAQFRK